MAILKAIQLTTFKDGFHSDGNNLYLRVKAGGRSWVFRYKQSGKVREIGLGSIDTRSLKEARTKANLMRVLVADGQDPMTALREVAPEVVKTFAQYAIDYITMKSPEWRNVKHRQQWGNTLAQYAFPVIGDFSPKDVKQSHVLAILEPIWSTKTETATRLRQRIEIVLDYAAARDQDADRNNPARFRGKLDKLLPAPRKIAPVIHHPSAPYADIPVIMAALRAKTSLSAYCLRFIILTACRSGEGRGAAWDEIDLVNRTWTIPGERMKSNRPHTVPLCNEAMNILQTMSQIRQNRAALVFSHRNAPLSDVTVNKALASVYEGVAVVHGFRSTFRDWAADKTDYPREICESALAHVNGDKTEAAYRRTDYLAKRAVLMNEWGGFCGGVA
jgi:integrase